VICLFVPFLRLTEVFSILDAVTVSLHFLALLNPSSFVTMIDINERAVDLASQNIHLNGVTNATALTSDGFSNVSDKFDAIVSNPPIRAGKKVIYPIFADSINHLNPVGQFIL